MTRSSPVKEIRSPANTDEWAAYYDLRWRILRAPWHQAPGSEKDELEENAVHLAAYTEEEQIAGVARLHTEQNSTGIIRYMAVRDTHRHQGIGAALLRELESKASQVNLLKIELHARENAVEFYLMHGYERIRKSHILFDEIQHYYMRKYLG